VYLSIKGKIKRKKKEKQGEKSPIIQVFYFVFRACYLIESKEKKN